jgi:hypothetical protein
MSQLKIQGARRLTIRKFHTEDQRMLGSTVQNSVAMATLRHDLCNLFM